MTVLEFVTWNAWPWIFLYLPLTALVFLCVLCLLKLPGNRRRGLALAVGAMWATAAVLFGGKCLPEWAADWTPLPLTDNLARVDGSLAEGYFPDIRQGRYFFEDRHPESVNSAGDSELLSRGSWNFTLAVYDCGSNIILLSNGHMRRSARKDKARRQPRLAFFAEIGYNTSYL